ncbi:hypothetical protein [Streptomyces acidiscabies]|uniref:hypothetical protein n=1 Tax=Streptomyces acidiscabies TaxID=42234 RepID=UPI000E6A131B|nr:hypothetical protein [Streptomyces acidiscabies]MBP5942572.1 hypothetical protein [Streptomyces sp. LBUM 1476]MBP5942612.1 hypothetical protein [Streptomyces sp. LBUM 1476]
MSHLRIMDSDPETARRTAQAVLKALQESPGVTAGNLSGPHHNYRDGGARYTMEVQIVPGQEDAGEGDQEVTVERVDTPGPQQTRPALPSAGRRRLAR